MRRCYRNVALLLGGILLVSNTFSNSCSVMTLNVHAAEDTLTEETAVSENIKITTKVRLSEHVTVSETVRGAENINTAKFTAQPDIQTGEENVDYFNYETSNAMYSAFNNGTATSTEFIKTCILSTLIV